MAPPVLTTKGADHTIATTETIASNRFLSLR